MGKCIIFCAAEFETLAEPIRTEDHVIAADGGLRHTAKLGITPDEILGDFDSLGYREFLLYGSLDGPRLDHTVANFQTLQFLCDRGAFGVLAGMHTMAAVVKNGSLSFPAGCEGTVSVFCHGSDAHGVTLKGLYYPLENGTLTAGFPLGVSNHFTGQPAEISVEDGSLLVLWEGKNGFPVHS